MLVLQFFLPFLLFYFYSLFMKRGLCCAVCVCVCSPQVTWARFCVRGSTVVLFIHFENNLSNIGHRHEVYVFFYINKRVLSFQHYSLCHYLPFAVRSVSIIWK
uniref:Putative secreted peptide n=1 Tax=Anopheles braziliensis TaxID=58242 RepID=A0A2M3ZPQ2_9DIPT